MRISIKQLRRLIREAIAQATPAPYPDPNCPECHGTGLYTGFNSIETCQTCSSRTKAQRTKVGHAVLKISLDTTNPMDEHVKWNVYDSTNGHKIAGGIDDADIFDKDPQAYHDFIDKYGIDEVEVNDWSGKVNLTPEEWEAEGRWLDSNYRNRDADSSQTQSLT